MRLKNSVLFLISFVLLAHPITSQAGVLWVDNVRGSDSGTGTERNPFRTVEEALTAANTESSSERLIVRLRPGDYPVSGGAVITRDNVTLQGQARLIPDGQSDFYFSLLTIQASGARISGVTVDGSGNAFVLMGIQIDGVSTADGAISDFAVLNAEIAHVFLGIFATSASGSVTGSRVHDTHIGLFGGPGLAPAFMSARHNLFSANFFAGTFLATHDPFPMTAPLQVDLVENVLRDNDFGLLLSPREPFTSGTLSGSLSVSLRENSILDNRGFGILSISDQGDCAEGGHTTIDLSLADDTFSGNGVNAAEPWEHTASFNFTARLAEDCFLENAKIAIADPNTELAGENPLRRFAYVLGSESPNQPGFDIYGNQLIWNDLTFTGTGEFP